MVFSCREADTGTRYLRRRLLERSSEEMVLGIIVYRTVNRFCVWTLIFYLNVTLVNLASSLIVGYLPLELRPLRSTRREPSLTAVFPHREI